MFGGQESGVGKQEAGEIPALNTLAKNAVNTKAQDWNRFWQSLQNPKEAIRTRKIERLPAAAMAFYRPFHFPPFDQWGAIDCDDAGNEYRFAGSAVEFVETSSGDRFF